MTAPTLEHVRTAIAASGYPLQFRVAKRFAELGFSVHPSFRFLNRAKGREAEIDLNASHHTTRETRSGKKVDIMTRVGVEVKDSELPFVLFGLDPAPGPDPTSDTLDSDFAYVDIATTRDAGIPRRFGFAALDNLLNKGWSKSTHHQLGARPRFHCATSMEQVKGGFKLNLTDKLWKALSALGAYADFSQHSWQSALEKTDLEAMLGGGLHIVVTYLMLVHRGPHYRHVVGATDVSESQFSSVFLSLAASDVNIAFVVDFVEMEHLSIAVDRLLATTAGLVEGLVPTIFASS